MAEKSEKRRTRKQRNYPAWTFEQSLSLAVAIQKFASGEKVNRLTLFKAIEKSPTSSSSQNLITNSTKYGLTKGSYAAEYLELTPEGHTLTTLGSNSIDRFETAFKCAIRSIPIFSTLYDTYRGKKLPAHEVFADTIREKDPDVEEARECIDIFVVNCRYLGLLQSIAGAETLVSEDARRDELRREIPAVNKMLGSTPTSIHLPNETEVFGKGENGGSWDEKCFYITPIGEDGSEERQHSDLFLSYLVEPALEA